MDGAFHPVKNGGGGQLVEGEGFDFGEDAFANGVVGNDSASGIGLFAGGFELRFYEGDADAAGLEEGPAGREDFAKGNERQIHYHEGVFRVGENGRIDRAGVDFLDVMDTGVGLQLVVQLAVPDIDADGLGGAGLKQAVGESAGRGTDIDEAYPLDGDGADGEKGGEFLAPAGDEARGFLDFESDVGWIGFARLVETLGSVADLPGEDEGLSPGAGRGEVAGYEDFIKTSFFHDVASVSGGDWEKPVIFSCRKTQLAGDLWQWYRFSPRPSIV